MFLQRYFKYCKLIKNLTVPPWIVQCYNLHCVNYTVISSVPIEDYAIDRSVWKIFRRLKLYWSYVFFWTWKFHFWKSEENFYFILRVENIFLQLLQVNLSVFCVLGKTGLFPFLRYPLSPPFLVMWRNEDLFFFFFSFYQLYRNTVVSWNSVSHLLCK